MQAEFKLIKRYKISKRKFSDLIKHFVWELTAIQSSKISGLNRNTINRYFNFFRTLIYQSAIKERELLQINNGVEVDESYFGPRRVRGKRGRGASKKVVVFGLLKRNGRVYTQIISRATQVEIMPIIRRTIASGSDIYSDGWKSYDALGIFGYNHKKVKHHENEFADGNNHINGIESFWSWTKRKLNKFNGLPKTKFSQYLIEYEWRFNHRTEMLQLLKRLVKNYTKN
jgi:transposase-like protein